MLHGAGAGLARQRSYNQRPVTESHSTPRRIVTRRFTSNADADRHDREFWLQMPPHERVMRVWKLSVEQWELLGRAPDEPGLCRSVASVRRR